MSYHYLKRRNNIIRNLNRLGIESSAIVDGFCMSRQAVARVLAMDPLRKPCSLHGKTLTLCRDCNRLGRMPWETPVPINQGVTI